MGTFTLVIGHDQETGSLTAAIPELPGCYTTASSLMELKANALEAIRSYLDSNPPSTRTQFLGVQSVSLEAQL